MTMRLTTRREFLKQSLAGAGLTIALAMTPHGYRLLSAEEVPSAQFNPNLWIRISPDNNVTIIINKSEMGQGVSTALPMIIADELEADWNRIRFIEAPAGKEYVDPGMGQQQLTGGSTSVRHMYQPFRLAGAAGREMLIAAAAREWSVPADECEAFQGSVRHGKSGRTVAYGQLAESASKLPVPKNPPLKKEDGLRYIGRPLARLDVPDKVRGSAIYGIDISLPGILYATIARPPAFGAKPRAYDKRAAAKTPGVVKVVPVGHGIAVVAGSIEAAWKGRSALRIKWSAGSHPDMNNVTIEKNFMQHLEKRGLVALDRGDAAGALGRGPKRIESLYYLPYLAHVTMEPMDSTASVAPDRCEVWTPTQNQSAVLRSASKITGLEPEQIRVHTTYLGGGFGRRGDVGYAEEAVQIAKAAGKPVKLIWTREEDIRNDVFRPGYCCRITGTIENGKVAAWSHKVVVQSIFEKFAPQRMKHGIDPAAVEGIVDMDYEIPNLHVEWVKMESPIPIGFWRSVGNSQNGFTTESFMDELAHAAGRDPVEFRLSMLKDHVPATRLIETAAEKSGWGNPPKRGQAFGMAYHLAYGSRVAEVAEVSVDEKKGKVVVHRVVCALDCGPVVVNPAVITAQANGGIIMGLSAALRERIRFEKGGVATANFYNYHELRISDAPPEIEVHILKNQETMGGIGEPPLPPIAPAVANAIFAATGKRIRRLPIEDELKRA